MSIAIQKPTEIPIGQRIGEILEERGSAFSIRAFSARIGFSKDMLSRMISGDRYISPSELEQIANGLSLTTARLKQEDTREKLDELNQLVNSRGDMNRALAIGLAVKQVAIGCTERYQVTNYLGIAYHRLYLFDEAHEEWLQAKEHAQKIADRYQDTQPLFRVMSNLVLSFTEKRDYVGLSTLVSQLKPVFASFPRRLAVLYYSAANTAVHAGNHKEAKVNFLRALELFATLGDPIDIGSSHHNVGYVEYLLGNYEESSRYFELAIQIYTEAKEHAALQPYIVVTLKDMVKTLLKLGDTDGANEIIGRAFEILETVDMPLRRAQFLMLHAITNQNISSAEKVLEEQGASNELRLMACKFLMNYYKGIGDAENLMRYYERAERYGTNKSAIYDGMGL